VRICAGEEASMRRGLSTFEKRLCNSLQNGLPISRRPYAKIARQLGADEEKVLEGARRLVKRGVIRRIGAAVNWRAIGKASTLVAAHIEQDNLEEVIKVVNGLDGVSHNYLREHHYNLWFTIRADSAGQITAVLKKLSRQFGIEFNSLPAQRTFKLDVRFDAESDGKRLLPVLENKHRTLKDERRTSNLSEIDERILDGLQRGLKVVKRPFDFISEDEFEIADGLLHIEEMMAEGVISRLGAIVDHHKLGFVANAMFVCRAEKSRVVEVGLKLAKLKIVSHCYQRKTFAGWPFNIFAMMHGRSLKDIRRVVERFVKAEGVDSFEVLATVRRVSRPQKRHANS